MPKTPPSAIEDYEHRVLFLRLGENISTYLALRFPDPFERPTTEKYPEKVFASITELTAQIKALAAEHKSFEPLRKSLNVATTSVLKGEVIQCVAIVAYYDFIALHGERTVDSFAHHLSPLLGEDLLEGKLKARRVLAAMIERGVIVLNETNAHLCDLLKQWLSFGHPLCVPRIDENAVKYYFAKKYSKSEAKKATQASAPSLSSTLKSPQELYWQLTKIVHGQNEACKSLATRGWLHYKRAELIRNCQSAGRNECLFFISTQSGVGKTFLAENYGRICSLPFTSFSSEAATAVGFVGLDLVEDSLRSLIRAASSISETNAVLRAQCGGVVFYDEFSKKRGFTNDGRDITGTSCQHEILRVMEGTKVILGNRRIDRDSHPLEVDTNGMMFIFGGYLDKFDSVVRRLNRRKGSLGFGGHNGDERMRDAYLYDALVDYGMAVEFLNRLTKTVMFRKLNATDLANICIGQGGVLADYNSLLSHQGMSIALEPQAIKCMAELCVESGMMARGLRMIVGSLVEDAVFNGTKGAITFGLAETKRVIGQIVSVDGAG